MLPTADSVAFLPPEWLDFRGRWRILIKATVLDANHRMIGEGVLDFTDTDRPAVPPHLEPFAEAVQARIESYLGDEVSEGHLRLAKLREDGPP
jgi:hypothetical protein